METSRLERAVNPIQGVAGRQVTRASRFTAYRSHTSYILRSGAHKIHVFQEFPAVSCRIRGDGSAPEPLPGRAPAAETVREGFQGVPGGSIRRSMGPARTTSRAGLRSVGRTEARKLLLHSDTKLPDVL